MNTPTVIILGYIDQVCVKSFCFQASQDACMPFFWDTCLETLARCVIGRLRGTSWKPCVPILQTICTGFRLQINPTILYSMYRPFIQGKLISTKQLWCALLAVLHVVFIALFL